MIDAFIKRWESSGASERANYRLFLAELCAVLEVEPPRPASADDALNAFELKEGLAEDCFLADRLLQRQNRPELAQQVLARARKLAPDNPAYRDPV